MTTVHTPGEILGEILAGSASLEGSAQGDAIAQQIQLQTAAVLLPEQDWCELCAHEDDPATEPGMPRDIVDRCLESLRRYATWESDPRYEVTYLVCGHTITRRISNPGSRIHAITEVAR